MLKKRLILIGLLLVVSIAGQVLLRPCLGESKVSPNAPVPTTDITKTQTSNTLNLPEKSIDTLSGKLVSKFILTLAFVAAAGVGVWWFLKRMNAPWMGSKTGQLELIETMHLGPRKSVHVIRAGAKQVLVGSSNEGIRFLCDLTGNIKSHSDEVEL